MSIAKSLCSERVSLHMPASQLLFLIPGFLDFFFFLKLHVSFVEVNAVKLQNMIHKFTSLQPVAVHFLRTWSPKVTSYYGTLPLFQDFWVSTYGPPPVGLSGGASISITVWLTSSIFKCKGLVEAQASG